MRDGVPAGAPETELVQPSVRRREIWLLVGLVVLSAFPALVGLVVAPHFYAADHSLIELGVRRVLDGSPPRVGVYSRYGWDHPGPAIYYLLAVPYLAFGRSQVALQLGALTISTGCLLGIVLLLRRLRGIGVALVGLSVCLLYLHLLPVGFETDFWNPYLPVLPFLLACVLCWSAVEGLGWALPAALVLLSVCVQMHIGYLLPVAVVAALTTAAVAATPRTRDRASRSWWPWLAASVLLVAMWTPPLLEQLTSEPGNIAALFFDLRRPAPRHPVGQAWAVVATELGRLPAFLTGISAKPSSGSPPLLPRWTGWTAVAVLVGAGLFAARSSQGRRDILGLTGVVLAGSLVVSAVIATTFVRGAIFGYLVQWTTAVAILLWVAAAVVVARALASRLPREGSVVAGVGLVLVVLTLSLTDVGDRTPGRTDVRAAGRAAATWAKVNGLDAVRLDVVPLARPKPHGLLEPAAGLCLELDRAGVTVTPPTDIAFAAAQVLPATDVPPRATLLIGEVGNLSAVPDGFVLVTQHGGVVVFGRASASRP